MQNTAPLARSEYQVRRTVQSRRTAQLAASRSHPELRSVVAGAATRKQIARVTCRPWRGLGRKPSRGTTDSYDEDLAYATEEAARIAPAHPQIYAYESG